MVSHARYFYSVQELMIDWISKKHRDKKRKEAEEQQLRASLAAKVAKYVEPCANAADDFTELLIDGKKRRVAKEQITITDVLTGSDTESC